MFSSHGALSVDLSSELLRRWRQPVSAPNISSLLSYLQKPLTEDEKIPISRRKFNSLLTPFSLYTPWLELSSSHASALFRVSDNDTAKQIRNLVLVDIVDRTPPDTGTQNSFIMTWDENIQNPMRIVLPSAEFIRSGSSTHGTSTLLKRPDLGCLFQNHCIFRGEEKGPGVLVESPRNELMEKLRYTYEPLQYILGYHAVGSKVSFVAITPSTTIPLYEHKLKFRHERVANLIHLIRLCGILQWMDTLLTPRLHPEYKTFQRPDGLTQMTIGAVIKKEFSDPDAASRVAHLRHIYAFLKMKRVPNVDSLLETSEQKSFYVITTPVGIDRIPETGEEAFDAVDCILRALECLHSDPSPIVHRDVRQPNIMKRGSGRKGWFLIDWSEASTLPTLAASHLNIESHSPRVRQDNHGCEVDIWGVGYYLKFDIAGRNASVRLVNSDEITRLAKRWMEDVGVTATAALADLHAAQHWF